MANVFLIVTAIIAFILTIGVAFYLVILYCSVDDHNQAWFPKAVVILGLSLSAFTVLLLPYDVANAANPEEMAALGGEIDTALLWKIVLISIIGMTFFITPFTTFYYEAWDPEESNPLKQAAPALCYTLVVDVIFFTLFIILWFSAGNADLPYKSYSAPPMMWDLTGPHYWNGDATGVARVPGRVAVNEYPCYCSKTPTACSVGNEMSGFQGNGNSADPNWMCSTGDDTLSIHVSAFVYMIGLMCFCGWFFFTVFGGVGLIALPVDLINDWRMRPKKMSRMEYQVAKDTFAEKVKELHEWGKDLERRELDGETGVFGGTKRKIQKFKGDVQKLEMEYERLTWSDPTKDKDRKVLKAWLKLPIGILGTLASIMWILHIIIYNMHHSHPFLNKFFSGLQGFFPLFGVLTYAACAMWLLWSAVKGCFKLGMNFGIIQIHPMKVNGTLMSSFLFNTMIVQLMSVVVTQFCANSFNQFAANTVVDGIFTTYVARLAGIGFVMQYAQIAMLVCMGLAAVWLLFKPWCCPDKHEKDADVAF